MASMEAPRGQQDWHLNALSLLFSRAPFSAWVRRPHTATVTGLRPEVLDLGRLRAGLGRGPESRPGPASGDIIVRNSGCVTGRSCHLKGTW